MEVCINNQWGTVCHDSWSSVDATVICKQLGYATTGSECKHGWHKRSFHLNLLLFCDTGGIPYRNARFGAGTGPIYLDDVACTLSDSQLLECSSRPILTHNCSHLADAGVGCEGNTFVHQLSKYCNN